MVIVYRGHNHTVSCDGTWHWALSWRGLAKGYVTHKQARCYCDDVEFKEKGFTEAVANRYFCDNGPVQV